MHGAYVGLHNIFGLWFNCRVIEASGVALDQSQAHMPFNNSSAFTESPTSLFAGGRLASEWDAAVRVRSSGCSVRDIPSFLRRFFLLAEAGQSYQRDEQHE